MNDTILVVGAALLAGVILLVGAIVSRWSERIEEEDEDEMRVNVALGHSGNAGGAGAGGSIQAIAGGESRGQGEGAGGGPVASSRAGSGKTIRVTVGDSADTIKSYEDLTNNDIDTCDHCGAVVERGAGSCWNCDTGVNKLIEGAGSAGRESLEKRVQQRSGEENRGLSPNDKEIEDEIEREHHQQRKANAEKPDPSTKTKVKAHFAAKADELAALSDEYGESVIGIILLTGTLWATTLVYGAAKFGTNGFIALIGASIIATVSSGIAALFALIPGKMKTILLAWPFAINTILLPPLTIATYEEAFGQLWEYSDAIAAYIANAWIAYTGIGEAVKAGVTMGQSHYLLMWFVLAFPLGWLLGIIIQLGKRTKTNHK